MRVGFFVDRWEPVKGGMERAVAQLVQRLVERGDDPLVYCLDAASDAPGTHVAVQGVPARRGERERVFAARALSRARADGCDVTLAVRHAPEVDVYWPHGGAHGATLAAGEASKGAAAGTVSRLLHQVSTRHRIFLELEEAALMGGATTVWCVSELVRREFAAAYPGCEERLALQANGVDRTAFAPTLRSTWRRRMRADCTVPEDAPVLLFLGGNLRLKGWAVLRRALAANSRMPWTCVVAGADGERVRSEARASGIADRVVALPHRPAAELFGAADLLVQPTYRDPCSLATLEALASGVPVLTTTANGATDAIVDPAAGESVDAGDARGFGRALRTWLERIADPAQRGAASRAARACTADRAADDWLDRLVVSLERAARR